MRKFIPVAVMVGIVTITACASVPPESTPVGNGQDATSGEAQDPATDPFGGSQSEDGTVGLVPDDATSVKTPDGDPSEDETETSPPSGDGGNTVESTVPPGELPEPGSGLTFPKTPDTTIVVPPPRD